MELGVVMLYTSIKWRTCAMSVFVVLWVLLLAGVSGASEAKNTAKSAAFLEAQALMQAKKYKAAAKTITNAQKNGEDTIDMSLMLTSAYAARIGQVGKLKQLGLAKKIKASGEHSLKLAPDHIGALSGLIQFHLQAPAIAGGDKGEARKLITRMIRLKPVRGHMLMANLAFQEENFVEAEAHINKATAIAPDNTNIMLVKGSGLVAQKRYTQALDVFEACLEVDPQNQDCRYQIGKTAQVAQIEHEKGKAAFAQFIKTGHDNKNYLAHAHYRLGKIHAQTDDATAAKTHYQMAVDIADLQPAKKALAALE